MRRERFQNKVATSSFTLPVAAILTTLLWCAKGNYTLNQLWSWLICGLTAYLWVETNNAHALIRIRSRLTPAIFLFLTGCIFSLHPLQDSSFVSLFMLGSYYLLFKSYQKTEAVSPIFHSFPCLSIGSLFFPQLLYFVPFYLWYTIVFLRSLTWRTFWASMTGLLLPYWFWAGYCYYTQDFPPLTGHFLSLVHFQPFSTENYASFDFLQISTVSLIVLFTLIAAIHYIRTSFNDKIRTRMLLYIILIQEFLILLFMALQPIHFQILLSLLAMNSAPILSHYFALTNRRFSNALFILFLFSVFHLSLSEYMDAMVDFLIQYGYFGMFLAAFLAASIVPFSSEAIMVGLQVAGLDPFLLLIWGTIGNVGGSMFNYCIGRLGRMEWIEKYLHVKRERVEKAQHWMERKGAWMGGILCVVPVIGDAISVALGFMRANWVICLISITIGKLVRYAILVYTVNLF